MRIAASALLLLALAACRSAEDHRVVEYQRRVAIDLTGARDEGTGVSLENAGPGPAELVFVLETGAEHGVPLPEGAVENLVAANVGRLEVRRAAAGSGRIVLTSTTVDLTAVGVEAD